MADLPSLRRACREARLAREAARRELHDRQAELAEQQRLLAAIPGFLQSTPEANGRKEAVAELEREVPVAQQAADSAETDVASADAAYDAAAAAEPPLWSTGGDLPLLLLPVRLECVYRAAGPAAELWIRAYPDDVHVDAHERELTSRERDAGEAYWRAVWAAGPDAQRRALAWRELLAELGADRALWALEQLRPGGAPPAAATPPGEPAPDPGPFPEVPSRERTWTRAPQTALLPDRLVFSGYRAGRLMWRTEGAPIRDVLAVGFAPPGSDAATSADPGLPWDEDSRWLVDFDAAVDAGMGVKVPLDDPNLRYDLVTVAGVSAGNDAQEDARRVQDMLTAHAYSDGLAVLPAGTPTNNTAESRSGWRSRPEPRSPQEVDDLRAAYAKDSEQPVARAARALAVDGGETLAAIPDALVDEEALAAPVRSLLGRLLALSADFAPPGAPQFQTADTGYLVDHFTAFVRSQGPLPALRVGRQPYGILPATALDLWRGDDVDPRIVAAVASTLGYFAENVRRAPRVGTGPDQDAVIVDLLGRRPSSRRVRRTQADPVQAGGPQPPATIGIVPPLSPFALRGPARPPETEIAVAVEPTPELLALVAQRPLARLAAVVQQVAAAVTAWDPSQPQPQLDFVGTELRALRDGLGPLLDTDAAGVLYPIAVPLLAGSILVTYIAGMAAHGEDSPAVEAFRRAFEAMTVLAADVVALEQQASAQLPAIERLLAECLDTTAHRVDAWATSLATARLARTRQEKPDGLRTGAYGWLVDVQPQEAGHRTAGDGYVVAPSLHHATTAAVLRSGWLAHSDRRALAVNLTSARVRKALALLDGARSGQPLEALLGYRFERGLHDAGLDRLIDGFRAAYPLAPLVDPAADASEAARAAIAARNVVDGEALRRDRAAFDGAAPPLAGGDPGLETVRALLAELDDVVDAVGDLLLAESVHHLVGGNPLRAGLAADAIGRGEGLPDDFEVVTTPRSGSSVTYAVGVLAPAAGEARGWSDAPAIAKLEPALERWCRSRLGAAGNWRFECPDAAHAVSLADLGASALEVVLGASAGDPPPLVRRLLRAAGPQAALAVGEAGAGRVAELAALADGLRAVLAAGTPLLASHFDPTSLDGWAPADLDELAGRAGAWLDSVRAASAALGAARAALDEAVDAQALADLVAALDELARAGVGAAESDGPPGVDDEGARGRLLATADAVLAALEAAALPDSVPPPPAGDARTVTSTLAWVTVVTGIARSLLGDGILLLGVLRLGADGARATLDPANRPAGTDDDAVADWLRELARVRPAVSVLEETLLGAEVVAGAARPTFAVAQAPARAAPAWVAITSAADGPPGRSCCVLAGDGAADPDAIAGLVVDAWSETIPRPGRQADSPEEVAAVAFHAPRPDARPPQALLLAVPPDRTRGWRMEDVQAVVEETFQLARVRTLDLVDLPELRGALPPEVPFLPSLHDLVPN